MNIPLLRQKYGQLWSARYLSRILTVLAFFTIVALVILHLCGPKKELSLEFRHLQTLQSHSQKSDKCRVPLLDPWHDTILKYYQKQSQLVCKPQQKKIAWLDNGKILFDRELAQGLNCWIIPFFHGKDDSNPAFGNKINVNLDKADEYDVDDEFVEVVCDTKGLVHRNVFSFQFHNIKAKTMNLLNKEILPSTIDHPSVIMIGLDSMSYGNFIRQMPQTHKTMKKMGFHDMLGHVKIGDNTFANWMAILTGKRSTTTNEFDAELDESWDIYFDDWDFVWKNFSKNGYSTLFAEDRPDIGTFNYFGYLCGFKTPPTDHYFRDYWLTSFWSLLARRSTPYCYDSVPKHKLQLSYLSSFVKQYRHKRHFAYWWSQDMSHDYLNVIGKTDIDYDSFLREHKEYLKDSIVIVFSDHGHRYDNIRETVIGRLEARLPFLSIRLPEKLKTAYPNVEKYMKENSRKLTTQFDLNESLNEIAWGTFLKNKLPKFDQRGYSLWHQTPEKRTCYEAGIPEDYCPCFTEVEIPVEEAIKPAEVLVKYVNDLLANFDDERKSDEEKQNGRKAQNKEDLWTCHKMSITNITYASIRLPPQKVINDPQAGGVVPVAGVEIQYRVVIQADAPSNAIIEGVVVKNFDTNTWHSTGELERNNKYGNTSHCVADRMLKKLCHCVKLDRTRQ